MKIVAGFALLAALTHNAYAGVPDGDFETPLLSSTNQSCGTDLCATYKNGQKLGPWSIQGASDKSAVAALLNTKYVKNGITFDAASGQQSVALLPPSKGSRNCIGQTLVRANNLGEYHLSFSLGRVPGKAPAALHLIIEGTDLGAFTNALPASSAVRWKRIHFGFGFMNDSPTIAFCNEDGNGPVGLDNVRLSTNGD